MLLVMRVLHIAMGVFWAGTMMFNAAFLMPAVRDAGPDGAKVAAALARRRFMEIMPWIAALTIVSGVWLYWFDSVGFRPPFMRSRMGISLGVGALAALIAFVLGVAAMRPAMIKAMRLGQDPSQQAAAQALRVRAGVLGRVISALLGIAVAAMAVARYI
jgi:uncharacterized membrane protein